MKTKLLLLSLLILVSAGGAFAQNNARMLSTPNAQTGTTYTFSAADTTRVTTFNNASPVAVTLPNGATAGFGGGTMLSVMNLGAGQVTITCSSCTINGAATLVLSQNSGADIYGGSGSPAVNYIALPSPTGTSFAGVGANNTFTGNNTHSGIEAFTNVGVFTNAQTNLFHTVAVGGINLNTEFLNTQGVNVTESLSAGISIPGSAATTQAHGGGFYLSNSSAGTTTGTGIYGQAVSHVNGAQSFGANFVCDDIGGLTSGLSCTGLEVDAGWQSAASAYAGVFGVTSVVAGTASTGTVGGSTAFLATGNAPSKFWNFGFVTADNRINGSAFVSGAACAASGTCASQGIALNSRNGGVQNTSVINSDINGNLILQPQAGQGVKAVTYLFSPEAAAPSSLGGGLEQLYADSTAHRWKMFNNGGSAKTVAALESDNFTTPTLSGLTNGTGLQAFTTTPGAGTCPTAASVGATCTTGNVTLPVGYSDTNYRVSCTVQGATNVPVVQTYTKSNTTFTITIAALTAAAANFGTFDCSAEHN